MLLIVWGLGYVVNGLYYDYRKKKQLTLGSKSIFFGSRLITNNDMSE
jgi:hypothetical protein